MQVRKACRPEEKCCSKPQSPEKLQIGDTVKVISMNLKGTVHTLPNAKGDLYVQMGILRSLVNINDLILIDEDSPMMSGAKANKTGAGKIRMSKSATISPEINLIGKPQMRRLLYWINISMTLIFPI